MYLFITFFMEKKYVFSFLFLIYIYYIHLQISEDIYRYTLPVMYPSLNNGVNKQNKNDEFLTHARHLTLIKLTLARTFNTSTLFVGTPAE